MAMQHYKTKEALEEYREKAKPVALETEIANITTGLSSIKKRFRAEWDGCIKYDFDGTHFTFPPSTEIYAINEEIKKLETAKAFFEKLMDYGIESVVFEDEKHRLVGFCQELTDKGFRWIPMYENVKNK